MNLVHLPHEAAGVLTQSESCAHGKMVHERVYNDPCHLAWSASGGNGMISRDAFLSPASPKKNRRFTGRAVATMMGSSRIRQNSVRRHPSELSRVQRPQPFVYTLGGR